MSHEREKDALVTCKAMLTAAVHVSVTAVMGRCSLGTFGNGNGNLDLLDANLVDNAILGVGGGGNDAAVIGCRVLGDCSRCDGRGGRGSSRSGRFDVVHRDAGCAFRVGRGVALGGDRGSRRQGGLGRWLATSGAGLEGVGVLGTILDWDVTTETIGRSGAVVVLERRGGVLNFAGALLGFGLEFARENGTVFDAARQIGASVDGRLEGIDVPTVDEIGMVTVSCPYQSVGLCKLNELEPTCGVTV